MPQIPQDSMGDSIRSSTDARIPSCGDAIGAVSKLWPSRTSLPDPAMLRAVLPVSDGSVIAEKSVHPAFRRDAPTQCLSRVTLLRPVHPVAVYRGTPRSLILDSQIAKGSPGPVSHQVQKNRDVSRFLRVVPVEGLEPPLPCGKQILSLSRLPFRHTGRRAS